MTLAGTGRIGTESRSLLGLFSIVAVSVALGLLTSVAWTAALVLAAAVIVGGAAVANLAFVERSGTTFLLLGSILLGYGWANVGVGGIPITEILLVPIAIVALFSSRSRLPVSVLSPMLLFACIVLIRLVFDFGTYGFDAVRDATIGIEVSALAAGYRAVTRDGLRAWLRRLRVIFLAVLLYGVLYPFAAQLARLGPLVGLRRPVPLLGSFAGVNVGVVSGGIYFLLFSSGWFGAVALLLTAGEIAVFQARSLYILLPLALLLVGWCLRSSLTISIKAFGLVTLGLVTAFAIASALGIEGRKGPVDASFISANAATLLGEEGPASGTIDSRVQWLDSTLDAYTRSPTTMAVGVGLGPDLIGGFRDPSGSLVRKPHNDYLEVLARTGAIGFFLYAWLLYSCLAPIVRHARKEGAVGRRFCAWVAGAAVVYLGVSAVQPLMSFPYGTIPLFFFLGMGIAVARPVAEVEGTRPPP